MSWGGLGQNMSEQRLVLAYEELVKRLISEALGSKKGVKRNKNNMHGCSKEKLG